MRIGGVPGGNKIESAALDEGRRVVLRRCIATPAGDQDGTSAANCRLIGGLEGALEPWGTVGIGLPGALSPATRLVQIKNAALIEFLNNSKWLYLPYCDAMVLGGGLGQIARSPPGGRA